MFLNWDELEDPGEAAAEATAAARLPAAAAMDVAEEKIDEDAGCGDVDSGGDDGPEEGSLARSSARHAGHRRSVGLTRCR